MGEGRGKEEGEGRWDDEVGGVLLGLFSNEIVPLYVSPSLSFAWVRPLYTVFSLLSSLP